MLQKIIQKKESHALTDQMPSQQVRSGEVKMNICKCKSTQVTVATVKQR